MSQKTMAMSDPVVLASDQSSIPVAATISGTPAVTVTSGAITPTLNADSTILASAARTATTNSTDQTNSTGKGVMVWLNIGVDAGGGETLTLTITGKDPVSGSYSTLFTSAAYVATTGLKTHVLYPGVTTAANLAVSHPLPKTWRVTVTHSAAGSWTYSVGASVII